jgi:hypothetical protein
LFDSTKYCLFASFISITMDLQIWHRFLLYFFLIVLLNMIMIFSNSWILVCCSVIIYCYGSVFSKVQISI